MIILLFFFPEAFAWNIKGKIIPFMRNNQLMTDNYLLIEEKTSIMNLKLELLPLSRGLPSEIIGYSLQFERDWGLLSLGALSSDKLLVDAGSLALEEAFGLESDLYSQKLILEPWREKHPYNLKLFYLSPLIRDNFYFSLLNQKNKREVRGFFAKSYSIFDLKLGATLSDKLESPYSLGLNAQALGWGLGFSFGRDHKTLGISYGIGPLKISLTGLFEEEVVTKKISCHYRIHQNLSSFVTLGSNEQEKLFLTGVKINF